MISILTPTFNRAYILTDLFESLQNQSSKDFDWIIVNDGSTDNTLKITDNFIKNALFPIKVITQKNFGKHIAINTGTLASTFEYIFIVDSDDQLSPNAIETVQSNLQKFSQYPGICFRRSNFDGTLIGKRLQNDMPLILHPTEAGNIFCGDLAYIFKRSALLKYPFPFFKNENFIPELFIWNKIGDEGKIVYFPAQSIYLCEYLDDGYSRNFSKNFQKNPKGFLLFYKDQFQREKKTLKKIKNLLRMLQAAFYILKTKIIKK